MARLPEAVSKLHSLFILVATLCVLALQGASHPSFAEGGSESPDGTARPVTINFDSLPTNITVSNQYQIAGFSSYAGATIYTAYDCSLGGSCPNGIVATSGFGYDYWPTADVYVNFAIPVSGLTFRVVGAQAGGVIALIDVYVNHSLYQSTWFSGPQGQPGQVFPPLLINLGEIQHVTGINIRYVSNYDFWYDTNWPLYYDDFTFTPELTVNIINPRVNGGLDQTTQNALLGADVVLQASTSQSGGTYSWSFTGPPVSIQSGSSTSSSITIRSTDTGTVNAKLTYTLNSISVSPSVNINVILPTLTSFTAQQTSDRVNPPGTCGHPSPDSSLWWYDLGCKPSSVGISFSSSIHVPTFISDPDESGVKYVQAVSTFRKKVERGLRCDTHRSDELNIDSGWQLDTSDPAGGVQYFWIIGFPGIGNDFSTGMEDYPGRALTGFVDYHFLDSLYIDERFETYVVYFTGSDPAHPLMQRPLGRLAWNWGGLVVFDSNGHHTRYSNAPPTSLTGQIFEPPLQTMSSMVTMQGNVANNSDVPCPGGPALSSNPIDSSRELVKYYYLDILNRSPDGPGWDGWTSGIAQCVFDLSCIPTNRTNTALGFFFSAEFIQDVSQIDPVMANPPGSPNFNPAVYNPRFVYWCYQTFLHRNPDQPSWDAWTNQLNSNGDYSQIVYGFIYSTEYRNRSFQ